MEEKILFPSHDIITTRLFNVNQDWEVPIPGFFIISTFKDIQAIDQFTDEEAFELMRLLRAVRSGMREVLQINEVYLFQNEDSEHGFHIWIFPRYDWMDKFGRKIQSVRPIINYAKESMVNDEVFAEVGDAVDKMKIYINNFYKES